MALNFSKDTNHFIKWYNKSSFKRHLFSFILIFFIELVTKSVFSFSSNTSLSLADLDIQATNPIQLQLPWIYIWNKLTKNSECLSNIRGNPTIVQKAV